MSLFKKNKKKTGVLLAVSSLPGNHGIGDFGECSFAFIDWLKENGYDCWQILPLNPLGPLYSPYMSTSSDAIEYRYISLDLLVKEGYLSNAPIFNNNNATTDYYAVGEYKKPLLYQAYRNFVKNNFKQLLNFIKKEEWAKYFGVFEVFKWHNDNKPWNEWKKEDRDYFLSHTEIPKEDEDEVYFVIFMQFIAKKQWDGVLKYAHKKGISIICDMPFYVGFDGIETWLNRNEFSIDENNQLFEVGGVGPDAFSKTGQLWGTPIYNFKKMKENGYSLLINRIAHLAKKCDYLRIDHFRAFDTYYVIPSSETTAENGEWIIGPREDFFDRLFKRCPHINIIAEDLGELRKEVYELRDEYHLPGMFVIEFTMFDEQAKSNDNMIVYSGTHDNETIIGWIEGMDEYHLNLLYKRFSSSSIPSLYEKIMDYTFSLSSKITIVPLQDLLKLDNSARMNTPGTASINNWCWKLTDFSILKSAYHKK